VDPTHITESWYQLFLFHLEQMEEGVSPGAVADANELSQEEVEEEGLGPQALGGCGACWGLAAKELG